MRLACAAVLVFAAGFPAAWADHERKQMIDAHAHYSAADGTALSSAAIIARLDAAGVSQLVVTGMPPHQAQQLFRHAPDRIIPLLGVYGEERDKMSWMRDRTLPRRVASLLAEGRWAGIGELHLFAADAGNPVFGELLRLADAKGLVVMIHGDVEVVQHALKIAPNIRVLWAHLGTVPDPELLSAMLGQFPGRLWIDTSVRDDRIAPDGRLLRVWRALFERHPDRFVVAVDTFSLNRWQHYEQVVDQIRRWTASLPAELEAKLLHENAARLFEGFRP